MTERKDAEKLTLLGNAETKYPDDYAPELLETFLNRHPDNDYFVKFQKLKIISILKDQSHGILLYS